MQIAQIATRCALQMRGLKPASELAAGRPHGDRLRYVAGCRCSECRAANTAYERARQQARKDGDWNGIVDATQARQHLRALSRKGIGRRSVANASGVGESIVAAVASGTKQRIRARTSRALLAVTPQAAADRALISARATWRRLDELIADGWSKAELARRLGFKTPALQVGRKQVTVRTAYEVERLYERLRSVDAGPSERLLKGLAEEGFRRTVVEQRLIALADELQQEHPDLAVREGRIRHNAAQLLRVLHDRLTA